MAALVARGDLALARQELVWILIELRLTARAAEVIVLALELRMRRVGGDGEPFTGHGATGFGAHLLRSVECIGCAACLGMMPVISTTERQASETDGGNQKGRCYDSELHVGKVS